MSETENVFCCGVHVSVHDRDAEAIAIRNLKATRKSQPNGYIESLYGKSYCLLKGKPLTNPPAPTSFLEFKFQKDLGELLTKLKLLWVVPHA